MKFSFGNGEGETNCPSQKVCLAITVWSPILFHKIADIQKIAAGVIISTYFCQHKICEDLCFQHTTTVDVTPIDFAPLL